MFWYNLVLVFTTKNDEKVLFAMLILNSTSTLTMLRYHLKKMRTQYTAVDQDRPEPNLLEICNIYMVTNGKNM